MMTTLTKTNLIKKKYKKKNNLMYGSIQRNKKKQMPKEKQENIENVKFVKPTRKKTYFPLRLELQH